MQEEHTTRIQIKIDDGEAQASVEKLVSELKKAQELASNLFIAGGGLGTLTTAGAVAVSQGGGGTTSTAGGGGGGGGGGRARDARGRFVSDGGGGGGGGGGGSNWRQRVGETLSGVGSGLIGAAMSGPQAGAQALQAGLGGLSRIAQTFSNSSIMGMTLLSTGLQYMGAGASMRVGQYGSYGQDQMSRARIAHLGGFDPGFFGAQRDPGTAYDAANAQYYAARNVGWHKGATRAPRLNEPLANVRAAGGVLNRASDPRLFGLSASAALQQLGGAVGALGFDRAGTTTGAVNDASQLAAMSPFLLNAQGVNANAMWSLAGQGVRERNIEAVIPGINGRVLRGLGVANVMELARTMGGAGTGLRGRGVTDFTSRFFGLANQPGSFGGKMDMEGAFRVAGSTAGRGAGMQSITAMGGALGRAGGAYQSSINSFGDMGEILSQSYAARQGGGSLRGYLAAQERFASNPRLYFQEASRMFGGGVMEDVALRQANVGGRNVAAFRNQDWSLRGTTGLTTAPGATRADNFITDLQNRNAVARAGARTANRAKQEALRGGETNARQLMLAISQMNQAMMASSRSLDRVTRALATIVNQIRRWIPSDRRLKRDIRRVGTSQAGIPVYEYRYEGHNTVFQGVMAQDLLETHPHAVIKIDGFYRVNYAMIDVDFQQIRNVA